jgi:hypothetical protein
VREWWDRSPSIGKREVLLVCLAAAAISIVQFFPLVLHLTRDIATDVGDPLSQSWQIAWGGHALIHQPLHFWQSNQFWPAKDSLAFSDALVAYAPFGAIGTGVAATVARYNLLLIFAFALCFVGAYLLAREFDLPPWASAVAGAAFAWSPWRLWQAGHMHVASSGGIALALFLLLRGYRRRSPGLIVAGWLVAAWQGAIGFTLGLQLYYLLLALGLIAFTCWWRSGRPKPATNVVVATLTGGGLFLISTWLMTRPYLRVLDEYPHVSRSIKDLFFFSPGPQAFITIPKQSMLWGDISKSWRPGNQIAQVEKSLYPGVFAAGLAAVGLFFKGVPKALRVGLGLATATFAILSMGVHSGPLRFMPYRVVYQLFPGWENVRTPGRIHTLTTLSLALLAAFGAAQAARWFANRRSEPWGVGIAAVLTLLVLLDGSGFVYPHARVPQPPSQLAGIPGPMLQLPARPENNRRYLLWSTNGFPKMVNGRSSYTPAVYNRTIAATKGFPTAKGIAWLRRLGVKTVVIHTSAVFKGDVEEPAAIGPSWQTASTAPIPPRSGVSRELRRPLVVYHLSR